MDIQRFLCVLQWLCHKEGQGNSLPSATTIGGVPPQLSYQTSVRGLFELHGLLPNGAHISGSKPHVGVKVLAWWQVHFHT